MSATKHLDAPMPKLATVTAAEGLRVEVTWLSGRRAPLTETIDLAPLVNSHKFYKRLRGDRARFETVHVAEGGEAIAWGEDIDMAATSVERLADEMMTASDFKRFVDSMGATHNSIAAMLGYSRRQVENFLSGAQPIPRVCALACMTLRRGE